MGGQKLMKKVRKELMRALSMVLVLSMVVGIFSGCGLGRDSASGDAAVQDSVAEVNEIILSSADQETFLLLAGESSQLKFDTANGSITDVTVTPEDETLQPYQYYTVTFTLTANENESFAKKASITLDGVELKVKKWAKDKLVIEYTTLALPESVTTDEMAEVTDYGDATAENSQGTAKVQALLGCELILFSEDGSESYTVQKGYVPLFMVPSFVANGKPEQIKDGERVQIVKEHGEQDFQGVVGQWYKVSYNGKVGYLPVTFVKNTKLQASAGDGGKTSEDAVKPKKNVKTRPAAQPSVVQNHPTTGQTADNNSGNSTVVNGTVSDSTGSGSGKPASGSSSGTASDSGSSTGTGSSTGGNSGGGSGGNSGGGSGDINKTVYYQIQFALGGGINSQDAMLPKAMMVAKDSSIDINKLATPSVPGYVFDAWYYDAALTRQVYTGDKINSDLTLYAKLKEVTGEEVAQGQDNYVSSVDVKAEDFKIALLKVAGSRNAVQTEDIAKIYNITDQETELELDLSGPENVTIGEGSYEKYYISSDELEAGATYQMQLLNDSYFIYFENQIQPTGVRLYNFTTAMAQVENLSLNSDLIYLKKDEVSYKEGSDYLSGLFQVNVNDDMTKLNTVDGRGSFTYKGSQKISVGSTVVIYDGKEAPVLGQNGLKSAQQYDGNAAYVTISKIEGNTYYYGVADAGDVLFTPDVLPVNVADDEDSSDTTVTIDTEKLDYSGSMYQEMGLDGNTTVDVGDYLAFYSGSLETAATLTYGQITAIAVSGDDTILTYKDISENEVLDSMTVYSTEEMEFELDENTARSIEEEIEKDAIDSGFAMETAEYLATVALATEELQTLTTDMGLQNLTLTREDGSAATRSDLQLMAGNSVSVEGMQVKANISRRLSHLGNGYSKNGANAQLEISFNVKIGSGKNQLTLKVAAAFEQEILLNLNIKGKAVWGKKWIFRYIKDYRITTNLDAGSYTGVGITTTIMAEGNVPEYNWSDVNNNLSDQIHKLMDTKDKFFNQDINSTGGGLAEKYANMLENNPDWIDLVNVNIFSNEARILAGIIVVGVQGDFVVSAKVNIMLGMSFQYSVAKRYTFTLNVFSKTSSSNCVDLTKSNYQFDMYVMGTLGLRAGIRLTVYAGLFSKKVAAIGITAEAGAYVQMWGYFYYSTSWQAGGNKSSSASGAMLLEVGAYLEIRFLATAFGGTFKYAPVLYDKYWPLWNMGSVENVYGFNYETTAGEADDKDIDMAASTSVALPIDRMNMSYMNLRSGDTADKDYTYSDFDITTTGNFKYENGIISVIPQDGSNEEKGTIKLTWKGAPLSFTSKPLSCEMDITWSDPSRVNSVNYDLNGGTVYKNGKPQPDGIAGKVVITGATTTEPDVELKKEYYTFGGWYRDADGTKAWNFDTDKVRENIMLYAKWIPVEYEITYELDDGTNSDNNPAAYTVESAVTLEDPVKAGYRFLGWYTAADDTGSKITEIPAGSSGARTLYARWEAVEQTYEIHHMLEIPDGSGYEREETVTAAALTGTTVSIGKEQSKAYTGFTFDESRLEDSTGVVPGEGTLVLKLYYSRNKYVVTFDSGIGADPEAQSVPYQSFVTEPEKPSREGYTFTGWYVAAENPGQWDFGDNMVTEDTRLIAGWTANTYNVTFDRQGGIGGDDNVLATYDSAMTGINVPACAGYQFLGYYDAATGGKQYYNADGNGTANWDKAGNGQESGTFTLYAHWKANSYQIAFAANSGEGSMENQKFTYDVDGTLSKNTFVREGYTFAGWANAENADTADYADEANVRNLTADADGIVTLYAVWKPVTYMVSFEKNGADGGTMEEQALTYDEEKSLQLNGYTKTGYHFVGWASVLTDKQEVDYTDGASVRNLTSTAGEKVPLYAVWEANTYTITFNANDGAGTAMPPQTFTYDAVAKALSMNTYTRANYTFMGWAKEKTAEKAEYEDKQAVRNLVTTENGELTLYAVWRPDSFQVKLDPNGGTMTGETVITMHYGQQVGKLPRPSRVGYTFKYWNTGKNGNGIDVYQTLTADSIANNGSDTLYAIWEANHYTALYDLNKGSGSSEPVAPGGIGLYVEYDSTYKKLPETSREGYTFDGWYTEATGGTKVENDTKVTRAENHTIYAHWTAISYTVTFDAAGGRFGDSTTSKLSNQTYDAEYQLPVDPTRTGYTFQGWYTGSTGAGTKVESSTHVTQVGNRTLYAYWKPNTYTVTYDAQDGSFADDSSGRKSFIVSYDDKYSLPADPTKRGYAFDGWYTEAEGGKQITADTKMTTAGDLTLYAHWREIEIITVVVGGVTMEYAGTPVYAKTNKTTGAVTIGGSSSDYNIMLDENVLTLNNATIIYNGTDYAGAIYSEKELIIKLIGRTTNTVTNNVSNQKNQGSDGIYLSNNLTIQGSGTLNVISGDKSDRFSYGIYAQDLVIDGVTVKAEGRAAEYNSSGLCLTGSLTMKNNAYVTASAGEASNNSYGIWIVTYSSIIINKSRGSAKTIATAAKDKCAIHMSTSREPELTDASITSGSYSGANVSWTAK